MKKSVLGVGVAVVGAILHLFARLAHADMKGGLWSPFHVDFIATCKEFPKPDQKIVAGGNALNGLSALSSLGIDCKLLTVIGDDELSSHIGRYCHRAKIDLSLCPILPAARTPTSYIIVDTSAKTRTIIHSATQFELTEQHGRDATTPLDPSSISAVYLDGRNPQCGRTVAIWARNHDIPVILDAERPRGPDFDSLIRTQVVHCVPGFPSFDFWFEIEFATHLVCSEDFCTAWAASKGNQVSSQEAVSLVVQAATSSKCLIITMGSRGSIYIDLTTESTTQSQDVLYDHVKAGLTLEESATNPLDFKSLKLKDFNIFLASKRRHGLYCPAYPLKPDEVVDTTAAGDVFIGSICRGVIQQNDPASMLKAASILAAWKCRHTGSVFDILSKERE